MNELPTPMRHDRATDFAEDLPSWRRAAVDWAGLTEVGAFTEENRYEFISGEIVPQSPLLVPGIEFRLADLPLD